MRSMRCFVGPSWDLLEIWPLVSKCSHLAIQVQLRFRITFRIYRRYNTANLSRLVHTYIAALTDIWFSVYVQNLLWNVIYLHRGQRKITFQCGFLAENINYTPPRRRHVYFAVFTVYSLLGGNRKLMDRNETKTLHWTRNDWTGECTGKYRTVRNLHSLGTQTLLLFFFKSRRGLIPGRSWPHMHEVLGYIASNLLVIHPASVLFFCH